MHRLLGRGVNLRRRCPRLGLEPLGKIADRSDPYHADSAVVDLFTRGTGKADSREQIFPRILVDHEILQGLVAYNLRLADERGTIRAADPHDRGTPSLDSLCLPARG